MAGDWIKMRCNLDTDPAVVRIASGLEADRFSVVGRLHKIWAWANEHLTDGQDVPITTAFLDQLVDCSGFAEAMRSVGWLSGRDGNLCFPSFSRHNGASAKARALDADRKKSARKTSDKCPGDNRTETGPEKRREEKSINTGITNVILVDNELPTGSEVKKPSKEPDSSGIVFAMRSGTYDLDERKLAGYVAAYRFDVRRELMKAALWLRDNQHRRPRSKSSMQAFITRWLNRHDDRAKPSEQLGGRIGNDAKLQAELERAARIKHERAEAIRNGKVPSIPTE